MIMGQSYLLVRRLVCKLSNVGASFVMIDLVKLIAVVIAASISTVNIASAQNPLNATPCEQLAVTGMQFASQMEKGKSREEQKSYIVDQAKAYPPAWPKTTYFSLIDWVYQNRNKDRFYIGNMATKLCRRQILSDRSYSVGMQMKYCGALETQAYYIAGDRNRGVSKQAALESIRSHVDEQYLEDVIAALEIVYDNRRLDTNGVLDIIRRKCNIGPEVFFGISDLEAPLNPVQADRPERSDQATVNAPPSKIGPSFACPTLNDVLGQLLCTYPALSRLDLLYVQAYQAMRQQIGQAGQQALQVRAVNFGTATRQQCSIPIGRQSVSGTLPPTAIKCVSEAYQKERDALFSQLTGAAAQEAKRPIEDHIRLQSVLIASQFLPANAKADGVYGPGTRAAISAWQKAIGRETTGLLGDDDAAKL